MPGSRVCGNPSRQPRGSRPPSLMTQTQSEITGAMLLRWAGRAALLGLLAGVVAGIAALMAP